MFVLNEADSNPYSISARFTTTFSSPVRVYFFNWRKRHWQWWLFLFVSFNPNILVGISVSSSGVGRSSKLLTEASNWQYEGSLLISSSLVRETLNEEV